MIRIQLKPTAKSADGFFDPARKGDAARYCIQPSKTHETNRSSPPFVDPKRMKTIIPALLASFAVGATCLATDSTHLAGRENKTPGPPGYASVADNDRAMEHAVRNARRSLGFFIAALRKNKPGDTGFEVKKAFIDGNNVEHLWIGYLTFDGKNFHGKVNNRPHDVHNVKLGQSVTVAPGEMSDWMFVKNGKLVGGYTTRVLYARLSPQDRALFDLEADFKIQ
jgi:uncharacterized protein YegJ (DUF2314 family)